METTLEDGFYIEPDTGRILFVKKGMIPPWVKCKPADLKKLERKKKDAKPK